MQSNDDFRRNDLEKLKETAKNDLFEMIGVSQLSDDDKATLLYKMLRLVEARTLNIIIDKITPEQEERLKNLDQEDPDALEKFLEENVPDYGDIYTDEAKKVRQELLIEYGQK